MLKFFRRIRSKLLYEGNFKRYTTYAFGEILLVMIGILLAFQVNNWNENRKKDQEAQFFLNRIISDLNTDIEEADETLDAHLLRMRLILEVLEALGDTTPSDFHCDVVQDKIDSNSLSQLPPNLNSSVKLSSFSGKLSHIIRARHFDLSDITFRELGSTGKIDVIDDPVLKETIQSHYRYIGERLNFQRFIAEARTDYRKALLDYGISNLNNYTQEEVQSLIADPQHLLTSLQNYLDLTCRTVRVLFYQENSIRYSSQNLITDIEEYLANQHNQ